MPSAPFGPPSGFAPNDAVVALINARLPALLADSSAPASH
jgi:hypothetical protein